MASLRILPAAAAAAILFFIVAAVATKAPDYVIQGRIYCDTCRAGFETNVTEYMKGNVPSLNLWIQSFSLTLHVKTQKHWLTWALDCRRQG